MKRYLLFEGDYYYPSGGWSDYTDSFDTPDEAQKARTGSYDWYQIVDITTGKVVE